MVSHHIRSTFVSELVHSDLCGSLTIATLSSHKYMILLIDDFSRFALIATIPSEDKAALPLLKLLEKMHALIRPRIPKVRTDHGGGYRSATVLQASRFWGIMLEFTVLYHSKTYAVTKQFNRRVMDMVQSFLSSSLPRNIWGVAVSHVVFTKNWISHAALKGKSPLEISTLTVDIQQ